MLFHELLITDLSSSVVVVVMAMFLTFAVTTCHVTLFIVDAAQGTVVFVKVAIINNAGSRPSLMEELSGGIRSSGMKKLDRLNKSTNTL